MGRTALIFACLIAIILVGVQPAFAGAISDLIYSIIGVIITGIMNIIVYFLEFVINTVLSTLGDSTWITLLTSQQGSIVSISSIVVTLGVSLASFAVLWQLTTILFGPYLGERQDKSVGYIFTRTLIFIPLTMVIQRVAISAFSIMQGIYSDILAGSLAAADSATAFQIRLSDQISLTDFFARHDAAGRHGRYGGKLGVCVLGNGFCIICGTIHDSHFVESHQTRL